MSDEMVQAVLEDAAERMDKAVVHAKSEFAAVRTGRASPALVEKIPVEYYGSTVPLQQLASFSVPEARMLLISPFDKGSMAAIYGGAVAMPHRGAVRDLLLNYVDALYRAD
jgi:ribosome recycling factor